MGRKFRMRWGIHFRPGGEPKMMDLSKWFSFGSVPSPGKSAHPRAIGQDQGNVLARFLDHQRPFQQLLPVCDSCPRLFLAAELPSSPLPRLWTWWWWRWWWCELCQFPLSNGQSGRLQHISPRTYWGMCNHGAKSHLDQFVFYFLPVWVPNMACRLR